MSYIKMGEFRFHAELGLIRIIFDKCKIDTIIFLDKNQISIARISFDLRYLIGSAADAASYVRDKGTRSNVSR